ncbi:MAG: ABC transporter permease [Planctomycetota bacterium]|jgi:ABC-2 type transport system permease protein
MSAPGGWTIGLALSARELRRLWRQPARLVAVVGTPLLIWVLLSSGLADSFRPAGFEDADVAGFLLPGAMTLVAVFASVFSAFSTIEDRTAGWLQAVLVSPAPRWSIAVGKIGGGALVAWAQAALLLLAAPWLDMPITASSLLGAAAALATTSIAMTGMGLALAWRSESVSSFHAVMNLLFLPLWMLSSAMFPLDGAAPWIRTVMLVNPLTWCVEAIRGALLQRDVLVPQLIAAGFALAMVLAATIVIGRRAKA